jgi:hypothetical protein
MKAEVDQDLTAIGKELEKNLYNSEAWAAKADILCSIGMHEIAIRCCDRSLAINPDNMLTWMIKGIALEKIGKHEEAKTRTSACNPQESIPLFCILLTDPIFASGKVPIPYTMESIIDNCPLSKKQHRLEPNCDPQSRAQPRTLRGQKGIYKNIRGSDPGREEPVSKCVQPAEKPQKFLWHFSKSQSK